MVPSALDQDIFSLILLFIKPHSDSINKNNFLPEPVHFFVVYWPGDLMGKVEWWNGGMVEWWNGGMVEWWNGGMVEWWNGRITERRKMTQNPKRWIAERRKGGKWPEILKDRMTENPPKS